MIKTLLQFLFCVAAMMLCWFLAGKSFESLRSHNGYNLLYTFAFVLAGMIPLFTNWLLFKRPPPFEPPKYKWERYLEFLRAEYPPPEFRWPKLWNLTSFVIAVFAVWAIWAAVVARPN